MVEHERLRRRRVDDEPRPDAPPAPAPHVLLALQRSAGNQAVARLIYDKDKTSVRVPKSYAERRIPWDGSQYQTEDDVKDTDPMLKDLVRKHKATILGYMATGLRVPSVTDMTVVDDDALAEKARGYVLKTDEAGLVETGTSRLLSATARAHNRIMQYGPGMTYSSAEDVGAEWVQLPEDFIAQKPDLPKATADPLTEKIPGSKVQGATYWAYVCVLIALIKQEGFDAVHKLAGGKTAPTSEPQAVKALHGYYKNLNIEYDDSSTRFRVMRDWGYTMVFSGNTSWEDLPTWIPLKQGKKYIADIKGHTVKIEVLNDIPKGSPIVDPTKYFKADSDKSNYSAGDELALPVKAIWEK
jgi:hypothetical protein